MTLTPRRLLAACAATLFAISGAVVAAAPAGAQPGVATMTSIRTGLNTGFDRIVLDMTGPPPQVTHRWTDELRADGSGEIVWLTGEHFLAVTTTPARAHDDNGNRTYPGPDKFRTRNLRNVMAVAVTGDYEGYVSIGLGTRNQSWVRVFTLTAPTRVVIDVGH
ncbi:MULTISPECIES: AMIN-like domain-containing (lipo)protein [Amycolatopsis]|uniref:AMIN-like domain-containing protein n=1 Tax=Amycolatopsis thermalba TaxID=944492 RepID=A0ABY4P091_9PSEU|nr:MULTISPECIES: hypothetical protein [Amycolatopsis]OXM65148.1 hypothetical protein CF166_28560 [Amycolatopsis sp. KNN50.9b]UQS25651.1 hypothetical protein L1857_24025 [Amycolatopsis thermalba]